MMDDVSHNPVAEMKGKTSLPRSNGELVFSAPWESRAFGLVVALHSADVFEWREFQQRLIAEISEWGDQHAGDLSSWNYYECWLSALERLLIDLGICELSELLEHIGDIRRKKIEFGHQH